MGTPASVFTISSITAGRPNSMKRFDRWPKRVIEDSVFYSDVLHQGESNALPAKN